MTAAVVVGWFVVPQACLSCLILIAEWKVINALFLKNLRGFFKEVDEEGLMGFYGR